MISTRNNFVFIHIPKTGGNSLSHVLISYSDDILYKSDYHHDLLDRFEVRSSITQHKHFTSADYINQIGLERFRALRKVTFVRNPFTRSMSAFFSPNRWVKKVNDEIVMQPFSFNKPDFFAFIQTLRPMTDFLDYEGTLLDFDFIARFEQYERDALHMLEVCRVPWGGVLPNVNQGYAGKMSHYDPETASWVRQRFQGDFTAFGYDPNILPTDEAAPFRQ